MTWWDHETSSIWSQPWGMAIAGPLEGTRLDQIPAGIMPWDAWLAEHPDTLALDTKSSRRKQFKADFVIGIVLGEDAKAYPFKRASEEGAVNDQVGPFAVVVVANSETKSVHTFLRQSGDRKLEFNLQGDTLVDLQTGSTWDPARGIAVDGPLRGEVLQRVPYTTAYDWAWEDFFPHTEFYQSR
jgi:hypothetical protein